MCFDIAKQELDSNIQSLLDFNHLKYNVVLTKTNTVPACFDMCSNIVSCVI